MCLRVFVATAAPLPAWAPALSGAPSTFWLMPIDPVTLAPIQALLGGHVAEVGAHTGCACGFGSGGVAFETGAATSAELAPLRGALTDEEHDALAAEDASRAALRAAIERGLRSGPVRVYGVWWGGEADVAIDRRTVAPAHFTEQLEPVPERVILDVV